jgi:hypothetical protein
MNGVELTPEQSGNVTYKIMREDAGPFSVAMVDWIAANQASFIGRYATEDEARRAARQHARAKVKLGPAPAGPNRP